MTEMKKLKIQSEIKTLETTLAKTNSEIRRMPNKKSQ